MELTIPLETVCRVILRAREYEAQVPTADPDDGSNPSDDRDVDVLEDENNEAVEAELRSIIEDLADDEVTELLALALVGRGTYDAGEWDDALEAAAEEYNDAVDSLLEMAMLAGYLDSGLAAFDLSCTGIGQIS